ncbi:hypothetical protein [Leifsonia sp. Leaf264]|uniref:hypothetical protein n=1 Tax=Leifsonia sp. Leaf264 TaxID=1736314 RepID=UPI0006F4688F|nr:hypothetical protein [Leifsonia sp. Leaf264]KQO98655.1 hypothetical protein ASF30_11375 [Leifsonia sp. Leaf264]
MSRTPDPESFTHAIDWAVVDHGGVFFASDELGEPVELPLAVTAHTLISGPETTARTRALNTVGYAALVNGYDVHLIAPSSGGAHAPLEPYLAGYATSLDAAEALTADLVAEVKRRAALTDPEHVRPILVIVDYLPALLTLEKLPRKGSSAVEEERNEIGSRNLVRKSIASDLGMLGQAGAPAGIHLVLGTDSPDKLRSHLPAAAAFDLTRLTTGPGNLAGLTVAGHQDSIHIWEASDTELVVNLLGRLTPTVAAGPEPEAAEQPHHASKASDTVTLSRPVFNTAVVLGAALLAFSVGTTAAVLGGHGPHQHSELRGHHTHWVHEQQVPQDGWTFQYEHDTPRVTPDFGAPDIAVDPGPLHDPYTAPGGPEWVPVER